MHISAPRNTQFKEKPKSKLKGHGSRTPESAIATEDSGEECCGEEATGTQRLRAEEGSPSRADHLLFRVQVPNARPQDVQAALREQAPEGRPARGTEGRCRVIRVPSYSTNPSFPATTQALLQQQRAHFQYHHHYPYPVGGMQSVDMRYFTTAREYTSECGPSN